MYLLLTAPSRRTEEIRNAPLMRTTRTLVLSKLALKAVASFCAHADSQSVKTLRQQS